MISIRDDSSGHDFHPDADIEMTVVSQANKPGRIYVCMKLAAASLIGDDYIIANTDRELYKIRAWKAQSCAETYIDPDTFLSYPDRILDPKITILREDTPGTILYNFAAQLTD